MPNTSQKLLTVRMDEGFLQNLRLATVAHETTIAAVVRDALSDWLQRNPGPRGSRGRAGKASDSKKKR
ncbi:hypothetical protein BH09SUM1_BH09SUM1_20780 [soil metagenome]